MNPFDLRPIQRLRFLVYIYMYMYMYTVYISKVKEVNKATYRYNIQ